MTATLHRPAGLLLAAALAFLAALPCPPKLRAEPAPAAGPPARRLTLEEARALALANNKSLELARLNVAEKAHATSAASRDYFPKVLGSVDPILQFVRAEGRTMNVELFLDGTD